MVALQNRKWETKDSTVGCFSRKKHSSPFKYSSNPGILQSVSITAGNEMQAFPAVMFSVRITGADEKNGRNGGHFEPNFRAA